jgi:hypothetical protein
MKEMMLQMISDGYEGYFSLEWEKKWHPELRDAEEEFPAYVKWARGFEA